MKEKSMVEATSCGGIVIFRGKILLLYKNINNKYEGWVLPKGTVEEGETHEQTALREVKEESDADADILAATVALDKTAAEAKAFILRVHDVKAHAEMLNES